MTKQHTASRSTAGDESPEGRTADQFLGGNIRQERTRLGMTQDDVAKEMRVFGWTGSTVAKVEVGSRVLKAVELVYLTQMVGFDHYRVTKRLTEEIRWLDRQTSSREAERRAAKRLGISVEELQAASERLWGRPFVDERIRRSLELVDHSHVSGGQAPRGLAGHVSRALIAELEEAL